VLRQQMAKVRHEREPPPAAMVGMLHLFWSMALMMLSARLNYQEFPKWLSQTAPSILFSPLYILFLMIKI
jgi:hypothetical protein